MSDHTPTPYFPANLNDYAPWVAKHGLTAPYGKCQCGCGGDVNTSVQSSTVDMWRRDHPKRFIKNHGRKLDRGRKVSDVEAFWERVQKTDICWLWTRGKHRFGYGWFHAKGKSVTAHRYSYKLHFGPIPEGMSVCHRCDNPSCVNPAHLFLGTLADNNADKVKKGRQHRGETTPGAKFGESQIVEIRSLRAAGASQKALALQFGTTREHIRDIVSRKIWAHVADQYPVSGEPDKLIDDKRATC